MNLQNRRSPLRVATGLVRQLGRGFHAAKCGILASKRRIWTQVGILAYAHFMLIMRSHIVRPNPFYLQVSRDASPLALPRLPDRDHRLDRRLGPDRH